MKESMKRREYEMKRCERTMQEWQDEGEPVDLQLVSVQNMFAGYYYDASMQPEQNTAVTTEKIHV